ncbi:MAG: hypothetical protein CMM01_25520 [Rhodopirellula sp.]|nr:hypothetical protein [Rhodopirellula sp.]
MKVRLNLDLDIELTEGGERIQVSELWEKAQRVAVSAAEQVVDEMTASAAKEYSTETSAEGTNGSATHGAGTNTGADSSETAYRGKETVVPPTLNPLGSFLCDLLDRVAVATQSSQERTSDAGERTAPR